MGQRGGNGVGWGGWGELGGGGLGGGCDRRISVWFGYQEDGGGWIEWESQRGGRSWGRGPQDECVCGLGIRRTVVGCGWIEWDSRRRGKVSVWVGY